MVSYYDNALVRIMILYPSHVAWLVIIATLCVRIMILYTSYDTWSVTMTTLFSGSVYSIHLMSHGQLLWHHSVRISIFSTSHVTWSVNIATSCQAQHGLYITCHMVSYLETGQAHYTLHFISHGHLL